MSHIPDWVISELLTPNLLALECQHVMRIFLKQAKRIEYRY